MLISIRLSSSISLELVKSRVGGILGAITREVLATRAETARPAISLAAHRTPVPNLIDEIRPHRTHEVHPEAWGP